MCLVQDPQESTVAVAETETAVHPIAAVQHHMEERGLDHFAPQKVKNCQKKPNASVTVGRTWNKKPAVTFITWQLPGIQSLVSEQLFKTK